MHTMEEYGAFLAEVRRLTGLEMLVPDDGGLVTVRVDDKYNLSLQYIEGPARVLCFIEIAELPADFSPLNRKARPSFTTISLTEWMQRGIPRRSCRRWRICCSCATYGPNASKASFRERRKTVFILKRRAASRCSHRRISCRTPFP